MFKTIGNTVFSFDLEWIPDPLSAEILHGVSDDGLFSVENAYRALWDSGGATEENPQPYLKTILCRVVSVSGILRETDKMGDVSLKLITMPADHKSTELCSEKIILEGILKAIGRRKPQLVGYNSENADLPIIVQRSIVHGLSSFGLAERPDKPWDGVDYFNNFADSHVDMARVLAKGQQTPTLHQAATLSGIPGKIGVSGQSVPEMWLKGDLKGIVDYNEFDAFTTHLLWARIAHFSDLMSSAEYTKEQELVRGLLDSEIEKGKKHLITYIKEWDRLQTIIKKR